jgi:AbrB family looped-hinge helix DNA binding protein
MARRKKQVEPKLLYVPYLTGKAKVSSKGWVVIPKEIRDELGIKPGDMLSFSLRPPGPRMKQDKRLVSIDVIKVPSSRQEIVDLFTGLIPTLPGERPATERLLEDHRREIEEDERRERAARRKRRMPA